MIKKYDNLYCKVFVDTNISIEDFKIKLCNLLPGRKESFRTIITNFGEIDINKNEDFDDRKKSQLDGFLYWKYYLDIEPNSEIQQEEYIFAVSNFLRKLIDNNFKVVAASDFEVELSNYLNK